MDWAWLDEARLVGDLETALHVIDRRLRGTGLGYQPIFWITTTPNAPGSILHKRCENPETAIGKVYRISLFDNAANLPPEYIKAVVKSHPGALGERFVYGRFSYVGGGELGFDGSIHVLNTNTDGSTITRMLYGVDWGWTNPAAIIALGVDGDGRCFAVDEIYQKNMGDDEIAEAIEELQVEWGKGPVYCGHDEPKSIEKLRLKGINALIREGSRVEDGVREIGGRFKRAGDGRFRLYISRRCVNLISELQIYSDENQKKGIMHSCDALRYSLSPLLLSARKSMLELGELRR